MRGVTLNEQEQSGNSKSFQLTRLMRGVTNILSFLFSKSSFQLTRLMRGVTKRAFQQELLRIFQLTRLMRGVTLII